MLRSGLSLEADAIVVAAGVRANIEPVAQAGVRCGKGIAIDDHCRTNAQNIFAAGDVTETDDTLAGGVLPSGIWPTAIRQGKVAGANMAGGDEGLSNNTNFRASLSLLGTSIVSLGPISRREPHWRRVAYRGTNAAGQTSVRVLYFDGPRLRCAILWGDIANAGVYGQAILTGRDLTREQPFAGDLDAAKRGLAEANI